MLEHGLLGTPLLTCLPKVVTPHGRYFGLFLLLSSFFLFHHHLVKVLVDLILMTHNFRKYELVPNRFQRLQISQALDHIGIVSGIND